MATNTSGPSGEQAGDSMASNSSTGSQTTRLTPESDSEDSDLNLKDDELGHSIPLRRRDPEKSQGAGLDGEAGDDEETHARRRGSASTTQSYQLYTPDEERAVIRKFDRRLVLFVALLYMLSFLDRSSMFLHSSSAKSITTHKLIVADIGNARIAGLETDLNLSSAQYEWVLTAFYIAYIVFEWMSLLWKIIPAHIYVAIIVLSWGVTASLQSCATSFPVLITLRFLLGIGEAGFTGIPYFLSFFFKRHELALRTGFFISAAPLATSFASSLAWLILKVGENGPIAPWRLLFLVEGFPSVLVAVLAWHVIPDGPGKAKFLTKREKKVACLRLRREKDPKAETGKRGIKWREILQTLIDPKSYLTAVMFFCTNMAFSSMPVFLPTIIRDMGHSAIASQALSAPPYLASFLIVILTAWFSDRLRNRSYFVCFHALLSASGYAFIAIAGAVGLGTWWRYAAIYPAAIGFFSVITIIITWTINNQESESKQGAGFAMLQFIGQCGPLVGTRLYPDSDAPMYVKGMSICAGAMVVVAILAICLRVYLKRENAAKEAAYGKVGDEVQETLVAKADLGLNITRFEYML